jgi:hypothetical protein
LSIQLNEVRPCGTPTQSRTGFDSWTSETGQGSRAPPLVCKWHGQNCTDEAPADHPTRSVTVTWPLFACGRAAPDTTRTPALRTGGGNRRKGSRQPWGFRRATACVDRSRPDVLTRAQRILCCLDNFIGLDGHCFFDEATPRLLDPYLDGYRKMEHFQTVVS